MLASKRNFYLKAPINSKQLYSSHFKMQDSAGIRSVLRQALIEENSYSIVKLNNVA